MFITLVNGSQGSDYTGVNETLICHAFRLATMMFVAITFAFNEGQLY
jgi:hypothetical protein